MEKQKSASAGKARGVRVVYNAPVTLTYVLLCVLVLLAGSLLPGIIGRFFVASPQLSLLNPLSFLGLFTHVLGHANWEHLIGNCTFMLLLGPMMEEKYGSVTLLVFFALTSVCIGLINALLFSTALVGGSGLVFALVVLSSITGIKDGEVPLSFIMVVLLFLGKEVLAIFRNDDISQFSHILGGLCGGFFGFYFGKIMRKREQRA